MDRYRAVVAPAQGEEESGRWLEWLDRHAAAIDPVGRVRPDRILTLRHPTYGYTGERILQEGFTDPDSDSWSEKDGQPSGYHNTLIEVRIRESVVLAYEWPEEGSALRNF